MYKRQVICIPSGSTEVELRAVRDSAEHAGGRDVYMIYEPLAAAIGIGLDVEAPEGNMIVDTVSYTHLVLRYGENPHQKAVFYKFENVPGKMTLANARVLQGKALSYNNMLDADAAWKSAGDAFHSVTHLDEKVAVSVIKHLNPCGLAVSGRCV